MLASSSSELIPSSFTQQVQQVRSIPRRWPGRRPHGSSPIVHVAQEVPTRFASHHTGGLGGALTGRLPSRVNACQSSGLLTGGLRVVSSIFW